MDPEPFKRSSKPGSPYYVKFMVKGRMYLWSTKTAEMSLARIRGRSHRNDVIAGAFHLVDQRKSRQSVQTYDEVCKKYFELPLRAGKTQRKRSKAALEMILKANGLLLESRIDTLAARLALTYQEKAIAAKENPTTINARLRFARGMFSQQAMVGYKAFGILLDTKAVEDFFSVGYLPESEKLPEVPSEESMKLAHEKLAAFPDVYRAFVLAAYAGLRAGEIKAARWDWLEGNVLYVGGREFVAKSRKWRPIGMAPEVVALIEKCGDKVGEFIVGSSPEITVTRKLPGLLRAVGFESRTPVHSLRRLFGSKVAAVAGLWGAQNALGHAKPETTAKHYARQLNMAPAVGMTPISPPPPVSAMPS